LLCVCMELLELRECWQNFGPPMNARVCSLLTLNKHRIPSLQHSITATTPTRSQGRGGCFATCQSQLKRGLRRHKPNFEQDLPYTTLQL
jgi:hypothetical protein